MLDKQAWIVLGIVFLAGRAFGDPIATEPPKGLSPSSTVLTVGIVESPPFAIKSADGTWSGLGVDLWHDVADELELRWEPLEVESSEVDGLLRDRKIDLALGNIAITPQGVRDHDFTVPYYSAGLGFAERSVRELPLGVLAERVAHSHLFKVGAVMIVATLIVGVMITLIERRQNNVDFGGPLRSGIAKGVWWAAVTMTTVGYGDTTPKTVIGRLLALVWMFVGIAVVAIFTATVTSILTVGSLQGVVQRPQDLLRLRLGAVDGGAGAEYLARQQVSFAAFAGSDEAFAGLVDRKVDALVADVPALRYEVRASWQGVLSTSPILLEPLSYAIGLPNGSPMRESINRTLLDLVEQERWKSLERQYLGHN